MLNKKSFIAAAFLLIAGSRLVFAMGETGVSTTFLTGDDITMGGVTDSSHTYALFTAFASSAAVKVRLSDMTILSTASIAINSTSAAIDRTNSFAVFGSSRPDGLVSRLDLTTGSTVYVALTSSSPMTVVVDSAGANAYFVSYTAPSRVFRVRMSDFSLQTSHTLTVNYVRTAIFDSSTGFAYFGTDTSPGQIVKFNLVTMAEIGSPITLSGLSGGSYLTSAVISTAAATAYFGTNTSPAKIFEINLNTFTNSRTLQLVNGESALTSAVIDPFHGLAYFGTNTSPGQIYRIQLGSMIQTSTVTLAAGENGLFAAVIDSTGSFAYFGTATVPGKVFQVDLVDSRTGPPFITAQPSAGTVSIGQSVTLSVTAGGSTPFTYQWKRDGSNIGGATSASYTTGALTFADNGAQFACVVTNSFGSVTSNSVTIAVQPVIKVFPNPWRSDRHGGLPITFNGAPPNARLKIYTLSMHWVKTVQGVTTDITWDRTNDAGQHVASGYYLYIVETDDDRQTVHGMFAIIK